MKWYKRDPDAALNGMRGLTHDEKSAYNTILDLSYSRDGDLPDDERMLCVHIECRPQWWRRVRASLIAKGKVRVTNGKLVANRVETTLKEASNFSETQSKRAKSGWVSRKNGHDINGGKMPPDKANTTTTTTTEKENHHFLSGGGSLSQEGSPPSALEEKGVAEKKPSPPNLYRKPTDQESNDYRSPPKTKSDNVLEPIPERPPFKRPNA